MSAVPRPSCAWPAVSLSAIGKPFVSTSAWILVVRPPRERPMQPDPPFYCRWRHAGEPGSTNCRSSAHRPRKPLIQLQYALPVTSAAPTIEAVHTRRMRAIACRNARPRRTGPKSPEDPVEYTPVIGALHSTHLRGQQRLDQRPLKIRQIKPRYPTLLKRPEPRSSQSVNPLYGPVTSTAAPIPALDGQGLRRTESF
jgi:hypothetical protein